MIDKSTEKALTRTDAQVSQLRGSRERSDAWFNSRNRFGGRADPVITSNFVRSRGRMVRDEAETLFEFDWLSSRIVEQLPNDATREWITLTHSSDPKKAEALRLEDARLNGRGIFKEAMTWGRLHGSALLVLGAWDGSDPEEPLRLEAVKSVAFTSVVDRWLSFPQTFYRDPEEEKFGQVELYRVHRLSTVGSPTSVVHESRTIRFDGNPLPPLARTRNFGWSASVLDKVYDVLRNWGISNQAAASVIPSFITFAVKIGNLQTLLANKEWGAIQARLAEFHAQMATHNLAMYGEGEEIQKMGTPIEGLPALMDKFMEGVAGAANIPKSILFQAETGVMGGNVAGSDQENWYNTVASEQETTLRPKVRRWLDVIGVPIGLKPGEVEFEFAELTQMSDAQKTELYAKVVSADETAIRSGTVDSPERLGVFRFGGAKFNAGMPVLDTKRQEDFLEELDAEPIQTPEEEAAAGGGDGGGGGGGEEDIQDDDPDDDGGGGDNAGREDGSGRELEITAWRDADGTLRASVREDAPTAARVKRPGSRGGHIVGHTSSGEPIYGRKPGARLAAVSLKIISATAVDKEKAKARERLESFEDKYAGDRGKLSDAISRRTKATSDPVKLAAWYDHLADVGHDHVAREALDKLQSLGHTMAGLMDLREFAEPVTLPESEALRPLGEEGLAAASEEDIPELALPSTPETHAPTAYTSETLAAETVMWSKVGEAKGSNPGGLYHGKDHVLRYVKEYSDPAQAYGENAANRVYGLLGVGAPHSSIVEDRDGKTSFASRFIGGAKQLGSSPTKDQARQVLDGFAADVLLGNWDVAGANGDNLLIREQGHILRIDNGSALLHRAKGSRKSIDALNDAAADYENFASSSANPSYASLFAAAGVDHPDDLGQELISQIDKIESLAKDTNGFEDLFPSSSTLPAKDREAMTAMMRTRLAHLRDVVKPRVQEKLRAPEPKPATTLGTTPSPPPDLKSGSAKKKIWDALTFEAAHGRGITAKALAETAGAGLHRPLADLVKSGHVIKHGRTYHIVDAPEVSPETEERIPTVAAVKLPDWVALHKSTGSTRKASITLAHGKIGEKNTDKVEKTMKSFVSSSSPMMRISSKSLEKVLDGGKFKNQYEVKHSGGMYNPLERKSAELALLGVPQLPPPPDSVRPIYGYLHPEGTLEDEGDSVGQYGSIRVVLKDNVKERTTFTVGDSLHSDARPSPFHDPGLESFAHISTRGAYYEMGKTISKTSRVPYVEAQYHGGISVKDIASVTFRSAHDRYSRDLGAALDKLGIPHNTEER